jgi:hypothetical protein
VGAEGDSRKQREKEQNPKRRRTKSEEEEEVVLRMLFIRVRTDELVERTSVPRAFSRSSDRERREFDKHKRVASDIARAFSVRPLNSSIIAF